MALALDDAHLADGPTIAAMAGALPQLDGAPVAVVLTAVAHAEPPELLQLLSQVGRGLRETSVRLDAWSPDDIATLVAAMAPWCADAAERDRLPRRLMHETAGTPFFAVTLLRRLERAVTLRRDLTSWPAPTDTFGGSLPFSMPSLLNASVAARVSELEEPQRRLLCAASIAGQAVDIDLVANTADLSPGDVEALLPDLERRHFFRFDGERYAFVAPLLAEVVRGQCLTRGERRTLRRRAIAALESHSDLESRTLRAELRAAVEPGPAAFAEAAAVARDALAAGSVRTARRALAAAGRAAGEDAATRSAVEQLRNEISDQPG